MGTIKEQTENQLLSSCPWRLHCSPCLSQILVSLPFKLLHNKGFLDNETFILLRLTKTPIETNHARRTARKARLTAPFPAKHSTKSFAFAYVWTQIVTFIQSLKYWVSRINTWHVQAFKIDTSCRTIEEFQRSMRTAKTKTNGQCQRSMPATSTMMTQTQHKHTRQRCSGEQWVDGNTMFEWEVEAMLLAKLMHSENDWRATRHWCQALSKPSWIYFCNAPQATAPKTISPPGSVRFAWKLKRGSGKQAAQ